MGEGTEYFTPEFFAFFRGLSKNNRKEWFDANKAQFQAVVLEPSVRFVRDAGDRLKTISPHIQDLRRKDFIAARRFRDTEVTSPGFLENFVKACESMVPLNRFLAQSMGLPW